MLWSVLRNIPRMELTSLIDVVVWNPWQEKAEAMSDFDDSGYNNMVCVEPGYVAERMKLSPGDEWTGSQWMSATR